MPTDKPYTVQVRLVQHDRPTRRVPPDGTAVGHAALAIVAQSQDGNFTDVEVVASEQDGVSILDTSDAMSLWLALGAHLSEAVHDHGSAFEQFFYDTVLGAAATILMDPKTAIIAKHVASLMSDMAEKVQEDAIVQQAKLTSTEGKN